MPGIYTDLIRKEKPLSEIDFDLIRESPQLMAFSQKGPEGTAGRRSVMTKLDAKNMPAKELRARIREGTDTALAVEHVNGQRYIAAGLGKKELTLTGTPGNALGAYLNGTRITVLGNAQDATGDTMNDGAIFVHGSSGDATGYAMRGGEIYVRGNAGYRAGIHMKAYRDKAAGAHHRRRGGQLSGRVPGRRHYYRVGAGQRRQSAGGPFCGHRHAWGQNAAALRHAAPGPSRPSGGPQGREG